MPARPRGGVSVAAAHGAPALRSGGRVGPWSEGRVGPSTQAKRRGGAWVQRKVWKKGRSPSPYLGDAGWRDAPPLLHVRGVATRGLGRGRGRCESFSVSTSTGRSHPLLLAPHELHPPASPEETDNNVPETLENSWALSGEFLPELVSRQDAKPFSTNESKVGYQIQTRNETTVAHVHRNTFPSQDQLCLRVCRSL